MRRRIFPKGTLVYRHEGNNYPVYVVVRQHNNKCSLALPWKPEEVLQEVAASDLERVFEQPGRA